jgi:hypothetical protein
MHRGTGDLVVNWSDYFWVSVRATFESMAELGVCKADVSNTTMSARATEGRHTFGALRWHLGDVDTAAPTVAQLRAATNGDGVWFVFAAHKNDPFGEHFGSKPAWLPYSTSAPRNACRSLVALSSWPRRKQGSSRIAAPSTFLFGPAFGTAWYLSLIDTVFNFFLRCGAAGLSTKEAHKYRMHSWRIYLACALYAAGCSNDRIMTMLRWPLAQRRRPAHLRPAERLRACALGGIVAGSASGLDRGSAAAPP